MTSKSPDNPTTEVMSQSFSVYLDFIRFSAAMVVYISHFGFESYSTTWLDAWRTYGSFAVMVFFVLSGFVIAYVVDTRKPTLERFAIDRSARLYSVVIPALIITLLADKIGMMFEPGLYYCCYDYVDVPIDTVSSVLFLNEIWFHGQLPSNNVPYWSIGYEAWYYVLFAVVVFTPRKFMALSLVALSILIGPLMIILAPVWFMGVAAYYVVKRCPISQGQALSLVVGSIIAYFAFDLLDVWQFLVGMTESTLGPEVLETLRYSKFFAPKYILGLIFAVHFVGVAVLCKNFGAPHKLIATPIRYLAGFTFSLYLFHWPLLKMYAIVLDHDATSLSDQALLFPVVLVTVWALGLLSERQKHRYRWAIAAIWSLVKRVFGRPPKPT